MNVVKASHKTFCYTVKSLTWDFACYDTFFKKCKYHGIEIEYKVKEYDPAGKEHYHGIFYLRNGFYRKKLTVKGMHMDLVEMWGKEGWVRYIGKDLKKAAIRNALFAGCPNNPADMESDTEIDEVEDDKIFTTKLF